MVPGRQGCSVLGSRLYTVCRLVFEKIPGFEPNMLRLHAFLPPLSYTEHSSLLRYTQPRGPFSVKKSLLAVETNVFNFVFWFLRQHIFLPTIETCFNCLELAPLTPRNNRKDDNFTREIWKLRNLSRPPPHILAGGAAVGKWRQCQKEKFSPTTPTLWVKNFILN